MKRITRKFLVISLSLAAGWYIAGLAGQALPLVGASYAESQGHQAANEDAADADASHGHDKAEGQAHHLSEADAGHGNEASVLIPVEVTCWYRPALTGAGGLFLAALVIGIPAMKLKGPEPADAAASGEDHAHH